jgi:hypothetical protein
MTLVMRDSVAAVNIPVNGTDIAAGYLDGDFNTWAALRRRFPGIPKVAIDVNGSAAGAEVRDWETGDKAGNLETWVEEHNKLTGARDAVVYCNRSTIPEVRQFTGKMILGKDYWLWVATLDGSIYGPAQLPGVLACQQFDRGTYDQSVVWPVRSGWWT